MTTPIEQLSFIPTGANTKRSFGDWTGDVVNVMNFGAIGDGAHDDTTNIQAALDYAYGSSGSPHGSANVYSNKPVFFPSGNYKITSSLTLRSVRGAHIYGAGRFTTTIQNTTANGSVFVTNGFEYSRVEGVHLATNGTGVCFDLDWDNTGPVALQSNTFSNMFFESGAYGLRIGVSGFMGSETSVINCYFANHTVGGLVSHNGNATQQSVFGGNFAGCAIGIWVASGGCQTIHGVGFQGQSDTDIAVDNTANDGYSVHGCRTESVNFCRFHAGPQVHMGGCSQANVNSGIFAFIEGGGAGAAPGSLSIDNCWSKNGTITGNGTLYIRGNPSGKAFGNASYLSSFAGTTVQNI